jgi:hypothetical protein
MQREVSHVPMGESHTLPRLFGVIFYSFYCQLTLQLAANRSTGAIGPGRLFSSGQIYSNLLWFFLVGPAAVMITYLLGRRWRAVNYLSWPVAFGAMSQVPPATGISFSSWWVVNLIFNGLLRRCRPAWWSKYSEYSQSHMELLLLLSC